ncbi:MAG TPA: MBL fold metallo-hydrolase, partial [Desulfobacterales bacterium]|nr:MBL fold metallo-hydrolase [Desulfobacterales bacterium]
MRLREITKRKLHHGSDRYLNPFGGRKHGNLWRVMRWKLFSENRFRQFYPNEPVVPVKMDWRLLKEYKGLGITFLKHATLIIKDGDDYIYIDPVFSNIFRFIKDFTPLHFDIKELPSPKHLLITHGH